VKWLDSLLRLFDLGEINTVSPETGGWADPSGELNVLKKIKISFPRRESNYDFEIFQPADSSL
jgi:hypothetical protein